MDHFITIRDADFGLDIKTSGPQKERSASRALIFDRDGNIVLLFVSQKKFHKLPGGGANPDEDIISTLRREVREEAGCEISEPEFLGTVEEYRNKFNLHQINHCFIAKLHGAKGRPSFEPDEIEDGFRPLWLSLDKAINIIEAETEIADYEGKFVQKRDLIFLKEARKKLSQSGKDSN